MTARTIGRNAATTALDDLIIEAYPSSPTGAATAEADDANTVVTRRELLGADGGHDVVLEMVEHAPGSEAALSHCGGGVGSAIQHRLVTLTINESAEAAAARRWLLRVHLSATESFDHTAGAGSSDGVGAAALQQRLAPLEAGAAQVAPVGGEGARPPAEAGEVVELAVGTAAEQPGRRRVVRLCVLGSI